MLNICGLCICNTIPNAKYITDPNAQNRNSNEIELHFLNLASCKEDEGKSVADLLCVFEISNTVRCSIYKIAADAKYGPITHICVIYFTHTHKLHTRLKEKLLL